MPFSDPRLQRTAAVAVGIERRHADGLDARGQRIRRNCRRDGFREIRVASGVEPVERADAHRAHAPAGVGGADLVFRHLPADGRRRERETDGSLLLGLER